MTRTVLLPSGASPCTRTFALASAALLAGLTLTGCSAAAFGTTYDKTQSYEFATAAEGKTSKVLPSWVSDQATEVREVQRTTGHERILSMKNPGALPDTCLSIKTPGNPTVDELTAGMKNETGTPEADIQDLVGKQHRTPLLSAPWWPAGQEARTSHLCGKWWVSQADGVLFAYSPEHQIVAGGVLDERGTTTKPDSK